MKGVGAFDLANGDPRRHAECRKMARRKDIFMECLAKLGRCLQRGLSQWAVGAARRSNVAVGPCCKRGVRLK